MGSTLCNGVYDAACYEIGLFCDLSPCVFVFQCSSWTRQWTQLAAQRTLSHRWVSMAWWRCLRSPRARHCHSANTSAPSAVTGPQVSFQLVIAIYYSMLLFLFVCFFIMLFFMTVSKEFLIFEKFAYAQLAQLSHRNSGFSLLKISFAKFHMSGSLARDLW